MARPERKSVQLLFVWPSNERGRRTPSSACAWNVIFSSSGTTSSSSSANRATESRMDQPQQHKMDQPLTRTAFIGLHGNLVLTQEVLHCVRGQQVLSPETQAPHLNKGFIFLPTSPSINLRSSSCAMANSWSGDCWRNWSNNQTKNECPGSLPRCSLRLR